MPAYPNSAYYIAMQAGRTPLGISWPGCAKTASIAAFAKAVNRRLYVLIGSIREPSDFGIPFLSDQKVDCQIEGIDTKIAHFTLAAPQWVTDLWQINPETGERDKWVICFDELCCCPPAIQAGMLRVVAENYVGDVKLPDDVWKCALTNPTEMATNGFELEPAMANRMVHLDWDMDWATWDDGMSRGGQFTPPRFSIVPEGWEKGKAEVGNTFRSFRRHKSDAFHPSVDMNGDVACNRATMAHAWPSPRTWDMAMDCRAAGIAAEADRSTLAQLLEGCVGPTAREFTTWEEHLDLPDPKVLVDGAVQAVKDGANVPYKHPDRPDKVMVMLGSIANHVVGDLSDETRYNKIRWEAATHLFYEAGRRQMDLAVTSLFRMYRSEGQVTIPDGAVMPPHIMKEMYPLFSSLIGG